MHTTRRQLLRQAAATSAALALATRARAFRAEARPPAPLSILVLGGTKFIGPQIVEYGQKRGHTLTLFNRGKTNPEMFPDVEKLRGDRDGDFSALKDRKWDCVIDTSGHFLHQVKGPAELLAPNVKQYVYISSCSVYARTDQANMDESAELLRLADPTVKDMGKNYEHFGGLKVVCEEAAEAALPKRTTIVRPGLIVGPADGSDRFTYWPVRVARGGEVLAPGAPSDPIQIIDVRDLGEWLVRVCEGNVIGTFNAVGPERELSMGAMLEACKETSGSDARFTWADAEFLAEQGVAAWRDMPAWVPSTGETAGFGRRSNAKAVRAGLTFRPIRETCKDTLAWYRTQPKERQDALRAGLAATREAEVLKRWHELRG